MKGICFIEPLFNKVVAGQKTQTRRIITKQPDGRGLRSTNVPFEDWHGNEFKPRFYIGETVYLKEPYCYSYGPQFYDTDFIVTYKYGNTSKEAENTNWLNKLFMPESAARYYIEIANVRVERLRDISEEDCIKEGITKHQVIRLDRIWYENGLTVNEQSGWPTAQKAYAALIDHINGKGTWDSNPWVWVYDFEESYGF